MTALFRGRLAMTRPLPTVPNPNRGDILEPGTPEWARAWNDGHRCERCGHSCGSTNCHIQCCGTEHQHRNTTGSYCSGHPCPACRGELDVDEASCRVCGCTENAACEGGCWWASDEEQLAAGLEPMEGDLCSACLPGGDDR